MVTKHTVKLESPYVATVQIDDADQGGLGTDIFTYRVTVSSGSGTRICRQTVHRRIGDRAVDDQRVIREAAQGALSFCLSEDKFSWGGSR